VYRGGDLSTKGRDSSTEDETRLLRGRLVYGGGVSSTEGRGRHVYRGEGETRLQRGGGDSSVEGRGRLVYRGRDSSAEGQTHIQRGRLVYGGGDSSTEGELVYGGRDSSTKGEAHLGTILDAIGNVQNGPNTVCAE
jgi:hypothetical protein